MQFFPKNVIFITIYLLVALWLSLPILQKGVWQIWSVWMPVVEWLTGGFFGYMMLALDRVIDIYISRPETKLAIYIKQKIQQGHWWHSWQILKANKHWQPQLVFHSVLFQGIWILLALFTLTSSSSVFGQGFVLGLGLHLLLHQWQDYCQDKNFLKQWLFWQVNRHITDRDLKIYLLVMTGLSLIFLGMVV